MSGYREAGDRRIMPGGVLWGQRGLFKKLTRPDSECHFSRWAEVGRTYAFNRVLVLGLRIRVVGLFVNYG